MEFRDPQTGQIKTWVWAAGALGFVVVLFLFTKVAGSGQSTTAGTIPASGQSSDITDLLKELMDAIEKIDNSNPPPGGGGGGGGGNPPPTHVLKDYVVQPGESWTSIASKFGMTLEQLFTANPILRSLGHPNKERTGGRSIKVWDVPPINPPPAAPTTFTLTKRIDTWREVAQRSGISLARFYELNPTLDTRREKRPDFERRAGKTVIVGTSNTH